MAQSSDASSPVAAGELPLLYKQLLEATDGGAANALPQDRSRWATSSSA